MIAFGTSIMQLTCTEMMNYMTIISHELKLLMVHPQLHVLRYSDAVCKT